MNLSPTTAKAAQISPSGFRRLFDGAVSQLRRAQVNRAVLYGVLNSGWRLASGPVTMVLIGFCFSNNLQGYYYTFSSLMGLQVFAELGLANVVTQFASHEWGKLRVDEAGAIVGDQVALSRLISLGRVALRWYVIAGVSLSAGVGLCGMYFFSRSPEPDVEWMAPWLALCVASGANLVLLPLFSLLLGCNQVSRVYGFRMVQGILTQLGMWLTIMVGGGLWAAATAQGVIFVTGAYFLWRGYRNFLHPVFGAKRDLGVGIDWQREIWPVQWKVAVSFIGGYFATWIFTPLLFQTVGPVAAGQFGMTMSLMGAAAGVASMWSVPRAPELGVLIARRDYAEADRLLLRVWRVATLVLSAGMMAAWMLIFMLRSFDFVLGNRLVSPAVAGLIALGMIGNGICVPLSVYVRAHKREPYMASSLTLGGLTALAAWYFGYRWGLVGVAASLAVVNILVALPWGLWIWRQARATWHDAPPEILPAASR